MHFSKSSIAVVAALAAAASAQAFSISDYTNYSSYALSGTSEASAITYNWDTNSLYVVGDEGGDITEYSKTGVKLSSMRMVGPTSKPDTEGIAYLGGGRFLVADEREQTGYVYNYNPANANASFTASYRFGASTGNVGLEGVAYDPMTNSVWGVKETAPQATYRMASSTANTWTGDGVSIVNPFTPGQLRFNNISLADLSDIYALSASTAFAGTARAENFLILSQASNLVFEVNRAGQVVSMLNLSFLGSDSIEGITMDNDGTLYLSAESTLSGGGSTMYVLNAVPEPSTYFLLGLGALAMLVIRRRTA